MTCGWRSGVVRARSPCCCSCRKPPPPLAPPCPPACTYDCTRTSVSASLAQLSLNKSLYRITVITIAKMSKMHGIDMRYPNVTLSQIFEHFDHRCRRWKVSFSRAQLPQIPLNSLSNLQKVWQQIIECNEYKIMYKFYYGSHFEIANKLDNVHVHSLFR